MFKKIIAVLLLTVLIGGGIFIVPKVIDWNNYQEKITTYFVENTGKQLSIAGGVELSLLPSPKFIIKDASLANSPDFSRPAIMEIPSVEISIDPLSLISGDIILRNVNLVSPTVYLERKKDGTGNWDFKMFSGLLAEAGLSEDVVAAPAEEAIPPITVTVSGGVINFIDGEKTYVYENCDLSIKTTKANGPYQIGGSFSIKDYFYMFELAMGEVYRNNPSSIVFTATQRETGTKIAFNGSWGNILGTPAIKGSGTVEAAKIGGFYQFITGESLDKRYEDAFAATFEIEKDEKTLKLSDTIVSYGSNRASLSIEGVLDGGKMTDIKGNVAATNIDLNDFELAPHKDVLNGFLSIPKMEITFVGDTITYRKQKFSKNRATLTAAGNVVSVNDIQVTALDGTDIKAKISVNRAQNDYLNGWINLKSTNAPAVAEWYFDRKIMFAPNTFRTVELETEISGLLRNLEFKNISLQVDGITATGSVAINLENERPLLSLDGKINAVNLDNYLKNVAAAPSPESFKEKIAYLANHFDLFPEIDKKINLVFDFLSYKSFPYTRAKINFATAKDDVTVTEISGDFGGLTTNISGRISEIGTAVPKFDGLTISFAAANPGHSKLDAVMTYLDITSPIAYKNLTNLNGKVSLSGSPDELQLDTIIRTATSSLSFAGKYEPSASLLEGSVDLRHNNLRKLLTDLGTGYNSFKPLGITKMTGTLKKSPDSFTITGMEMSVGAETVTGTVSYEKSETQRPQFTASLHGDHITLKDYLPPTELRLWSRGTDKLRPNWEKDPLDIALFKDMDARVEFSFDSLAYDDLALQKGQGLFTADNQNLFLEVKKAKFLEGDFAIKADLDLNMDKHPFNIEGKILKAKIAQPVFRTAVFDLIEATASLDYSFKSAGESIDEIVSSLDGSLNYTLESPHIKGADFNKLATLVVDTYENKKEIREKDFSEYVDLYLRQGVTSSPKISGTISIGDGTISASTQPFEITGKAASQFTAEIKILNWDIISSWNMKVMNDDRLAFAIDLEGPLEAPRRQAKGEEAKRFVITSLGEYMRASKNQALNLSKDFSGIIAQLQAILPKIREAEQQAKEIAGSDPKLQKHYKEVTAITKSIGTEVKKIKSLYDLKEKSAQDLQSANNSLARIESLYEDIKKQTRSTIREDAKMRIEQIAKNIFDAEASAKAIAANNADALEIYREIANTSAKTRKAIALVDKISTTKDAEALEEKLSASWDRVKYLINYLRDTATGQISGTSNLFRDDSYGDRIPEAPGMGSPMTRKSS